MRLVPRHKLPVQSEEGNMKLSFFLRNGLKLDVTIPPEQIAVNFVTLMKAIRADGHFLTSGMYIDATDIVACALGDEQPVTMHDAPVPVRGDLN